MRNHVFPGGHFEPLGLLAADIAHAGVLEKQGGLPVVEQSQVVAEGDVSLQHYAQRGFSGKLTRVEPGIVVLGRGGSDEYGRFATSQTVNPLFGGGARYPEDSVVAFGMSVQVHYAVGG